MEIKFEKDYLRELFYDGVAKDKKLCYVKGRRRS